ncbi:MAG: flippase-like domain-containing protein [Methanothrix sp.]|nr:flippase-like domain-containing protein [Methanothrix sp.]
MSSSLREERLRAVIFATLMSLSAVIIITKFTDANVSWQMISQIDGRFLLLGLAIHMLSWVFYAIRLRFLTSLAGHRISFRLSLKSTLASNFLAALTPSSAGGEPLRIKILADDGMSYGSATAVAVGERLLDSIFLVGALAFFLMFTNFFTGFGLKIGAIFLVLLFLILAFLWMLVAQPNRIAHLIGWAKKKTGNRPIVISIEKEIWLFREAGMQLARETLRHKPMMLAMTAMIWMSEFLVPSALLVGMGADPSFLLSITSQIILAIIGILPLTPGSSGVAELSMSYLYSMFISSSLLGPLVALWRIITYFCNIVVGAAFAGASINGAMKNRK